MKIKINNTEYDFFNQAKIDLKYNSIASSFQFSAFFDPNDPLHRELFRPLSFQRVVITEGRFTIMTGVTISHSFTVESNIKVATVTGYSLPGVLQDANISPDQYPLEVNGLTFREILSKLLKPFGLSFIVSDVVSDAVDRVIEKIEAKESQTVFSFINEIASQRNILLTHDEFGRLIVTRADAVGRAITIYREGIPANRIRLKTNGQKMHSQIFVQKQADVVNDNASEAQINNPYVNVYRPFVKTQTTGDDVTVAEAARNALSNELKNITLQIDSDRWFWLNNGRLEVTRPNNTIGVIAPNLYLPNLQRFFVESVTLSQDNKQQVSKINCVLPEVYNDNNVKNIF